MLLVVVAGETTMTMMEKGKQQEQEDPASDIDSGHEDGDDTSIPSLPAAVSGAKKRKAAGAAAAAAAAGGRAINECWKYLSTKIDQHLATETRCMNCGQMVRHHRKSEKVKAHLNRCRPFLSSLRHAGRHDNFEVDIPNWVVWTGSNTKKLTTERNGQRLFASPDTTATPVSTAAATNDTTGFAAGSYASLSTTPGKPRSRTTTSSNTVRSRASTTTTSTKMRANTMHGFLVPSLSPTDQAAFHEQMAMHFYMCATPFSRVEEPHLLQAMKKLRPDVKLPSRRDLGGKLLQGAHKKVKLKVDSWLKRDRFACITSDAWSDIKNESVINYMMVSGEVTFFLESTRSGELSHSAEYLAGDIDRVIRQMQAKIAGVVMDNTAANKKTWKILKEKHASMFFQGCVAHGLHLLVKDVFAATKTFWNRGLVPEYPDGYPFESLLIFVADCKKVVKYFHNHHGPKALLSKALRAAGKRELVQIAATRWGSLIGMARSLLEAEAVLYQMVTGRDFVIGTNAQKKEKQAIVDIVTNRMFVASLEKTIEIVTPIDAANVYYQSDEVPLSEVYRTFLMKLPASFAAMKLITEAEKDYLLQLVQKRMEFMYGDAHGIAYLLDPRYIGDGMSMDKRMAVEDLIVAHPSADSNTIPTPEQQQSVFDDYTNFRIAVQEMKQSASITGRMRQSIGPLKFWLSNGDGYPFLQQLAKQVFSMVASSAASERNFSAFAHIQPKLRNRLGVGVLEKLVYVRTNNMQFMKHDAKRSGLPQQLSCFDDEDDDDADESVGTMESD